MSGANQCPSLKRRRRWALNAAKMVERFIAIEPTLTTTRSSKPLRNRICYCISVPCDHRHSNTTFLTL